MRKSKQITKANKQERARQTKYSSGSISAEQESEHEEDGREVTKKRNKCNAELSRIKNRLAFAYTKNTDYIRQKNRHVAQQDIKILILRSALIDFVQLQYPLLVDKQKKQGQPTSPYFCMHEHISPAIRPNFINFMANLLSYSAQQMFEQGKDELMDHNLRPQAANWRGPVEQSIDFVDSLFRNKHQGNRDGFRMWNKEVWMESQQQELLRQPVTRQVNNSSRINKKVVLMLFLATILCVFPNENSLSAYSPSSDWASAPASSPAPTRRALQQDSKIPDFLNNQTIIPEHHPGQLFTDAFVSYNDALLGLILTAMTVLIILILADFYFCLRDQKQKGRQKTDNSLTKQSLTSRQDDTILFI